MSSPGTKKDSSQWRRQTLAVRGGQVRSNFGEASEALYLTSGYVYDAAEMAEARFRGEASNWAQELLGKLGVCVSPLSSPLFSITPVSYTHLYAKIP